jgi:Domain of unknown function (DUF4258)
MAVSEPDEILAAVRQCARERILFLPHAVRQMSRPDRMISAAEVRAVIEGGEMVEDYPEDARGHRVLLAGTGDGGRALHVVCSPKAGFVAVITAYLPDPEDWSPDFRERKRR